MNNPQEVAKAALTLRRSILLWRVFACFMLGFVAVAFIAPDELAKVNIKPSKSTLALTEVHGTLLLVASLFSIKAIQISLIVIAVLLVLAMGYAIALQSTFAAIFVGLLISMRLLRFGPSAATVPTSMRHRPSDLESCKPVSKTALWV